MSMRSRELSQKQNFWEDKAMIDEVNRIGNGRIVLAGLWTSVCMVGPTLSAIEVYVIADACGDVSVEARELATERMAQAGARPLTSLQYLLELQRDWARAVTDEAAPAFRGAYGLGLICAKAMLGSHASEAGRAAQSLGRGLASALLSHRSEGDLAMRMYVVALAAGALVGVIYGLIDVRSPAPPVVALVGLLGILAGEQVVPFAKRVIAREPVDISWVKAECVPHIFGELPTKAAGGAAAQKRFEHEC
jgi:XapX domain-containing protein